MKIVRYHKASAGGDLTFSVEATISKPFENSPLITYFRRCSWSPDGGAIAAANATNGPVPTVAIIARGSWTSDISLVGHEGPVEVATFSPRIYINPNQNENTGSMSNGNDESAAHHKNQQDDFLTIVACAGHDKTLSLWNSSKPRPIFTTQEITAKAITDISWSADGQSLFLCSLDGSILCCIFEKNELGIIEPLSINDKQLQRFGGGRESLQFPESVDQLILEEKAKQQETESIPKSTENESPANKNLTPAAVITTPTTSFADAAAAAQPSTTTTTVNGGTPKRIQQKVTITKEGKKRVAPQLVSSGGPTMPSQFNNVTTRSSQLLDNQLNVLDLSKPSDALPLGGMTTLVSGTKRKRGNDDEATAGAILSANIHPRIPEVPQFIRPAVASPASSVSQVRLAVPKLRNVINQEIKETKFVMEARNGSASEYEPSRIVVYKDSQILWTDFLPKMILLVSGGDEFWAVATEDGCVYVYSRAGALLLPPIVLESSPCFLESKNDFLMCVTSIGMLHIWNIRDKSAPHQPVSLAPILDCAGLIEGHLKKGPSITFCAVSGGGAPIVALSNGDVFTYSAPMYSWNRISEVWWAVGSQYWNSSGIQPVFSPAATSNGGVHASLISLIERRTDEEVIRHGRGRLLQRLVKSAMMRPGWEGIDNVISIRHLETRLGACATLQSKPEFETLLLMYARRLAEEGLTDRLEELCSGLTKPTLTLLSSGDDEEEKPRSWEPMVCGLDKEQLLKKIILALGKNRDVQRIVQKYGQNLGT